MKIRNQDTQKAKKSDSQKRVQNFAVKSELKSGLDYCCPGPNPGSCHPGLPKNCYVNWMGDCCCPIAEA